MTRLAKRKIRSSRHRLTKYDGPNQNITEDEKIRLLQQIATYATLEELEDWCEENLARPISLHTIKYHKNNPNNQPLLKKMREEFNTALLSVEWSSKRKRLEYLGSVFKKAFAEKKYAPAISAIHEMREEMEGKKSPGVNLYQYNYVNMTDEELDKKRLELIETVQKHKIINAEIIENNHTENADSEN
jgi:hypothetical protein